MAEEQKAPSKAATLGISPPLAHRVDLVVELSALFDSYIAANPYSRTPLQDFQAAYRMVTLAIKDRSKEVTDARMRELVLSVMGRPN